ncbi:MAG: hypothetical protein WAU28_03050 [Candidatus Moraniibacteriota bacterium]
MNFDIHQKVSSVLALLFIALLSTLLGIITIYESDQAVEGFSVTMSAHDQALGTLNK